ncbi:unnamed protein product [Medioppia subpectinata]|uniref:FHA domain-containing protein n=1 Tax=Medioppia subpectinata TaxID=1979941 RepID=A0A7R9KV56_9ACAR|nr:unnamed protein product [Medioppia subpectinata]CAG2110053.1 unnamed protein product [Medioppia subpectinata]
MDPIDTEVVFKVPLNTSKEHNESANTAQEVVRSGSAAETGETKTLDTPAIVSEPVAKPAATGVVSKTVMPEPMTRVTPPDGQYFVDQLKNGVIVGHKTVAKSRLVFGRAVDCDVVLEHPSVSRYHAVLLWSPLNDEDYVSGKNKDSFCWGINDDTDTAGEVTGDSMALQAVVTAMKSGDSDGQTANANVYSANPNKCIQQWFDREGYDLEYKCDTIHNKFRCTLELPIDGQWIPVEGSLLPKKKEAITEACLRGCQLLDKAKLLFPWQQQEALELRRKHNEDMDFEVDDMIDETVKISHKRLKRSSESDDSGAKADTFESLNQKWSEMNDELRQLRIKMANIGAKGDVQRPNPAQESGDSLDDYMAAIERPKYGLTMNDKIEKSKVKMKINLLEKEQQKVEKLIKLAKPSVEFEPIVPALPAVDISTKTETIASIVDSCVKTGVKSETIVTKQSAGQTSNAEIVDKSAPKETKEEAVKRKTETIINELKSSAKPKAESKVKRKLNSQSIVDAIEKEKQLEKTKQKATYDSDYVDWLPPTGQLGDGKTTLNDKFGY